MATTKPHEGDSVIILSSELIATVMQQYFNDTMFKLPVEVVDLQPSSTGYAFTLSFNHTPEISAPQVPQAVPIRGSNGKFKGRKRLADLNNNTGFTTPVEEQTHG